MSFPRSNAQSDLLEAVLALDPADGCPRAGEGIVVLEAMKMENQINADAPGTVAAIKVAAGDTVGGGDVFVVIE